MKIFKIFLAIFVVTFSSQAFAQPLSLSGAIDQALQYSPDIKSAQEQVSSSEARKKLAFAPSDPSISVFHNDQPSFASKAASTAYQIAQPIAFPGKAFTNYDLGSNQVKVMKAKQEAMRLQVINNVKQAYYKLALARKGIELRKALKDDYDRIIAIAKRRYESGNITQGDYLNAQIAVYSGDNEIKDLEALEYKSRAQLNILLGQPADMAIETENLDYQFSPDINKSEATEKMLRNQPDIAASQAQFEASKVGYKLAKMSLLPDFQLVAGMTNYNASTASPYNGAATPYDKTYSIGLQMTIPLWSPISERYSIIAAKHEKNAAAANLDTTINQLSANLNATIDAIKLLSAKLENYQQHLLPLSEQSFKLALTNYGTGRIDFQALTQAAQAKRNVQNDYDSTIVDYLTFYDFYHQLIGEDL